MKTDKGELTAYRRQPGVITFAIRIGRNEFLDLDLTDEQVDAFQFEIINAVSSPPPIPSDVLTTPVVNGESRDV